MESASAPLLQLDAAKALLGEFDAFLGQRALPAVLNPHMEAREAMVDFVEKGPFGPWPPGAESPMAWWPLDLLVRRRAGVGAVSVIFFIWFLHASSCC